jgi:hypothetical protein
MVNKPIHDESLDSFTEFKEGVEFLKNDYPQEALVKLQSAFESNKHNPFYISFLGVSIARAQRNWAKASELCDMAVQFKFQGNPVPSQSRRGLLTCRVA